MENVDKKEQASKKTRVKGRRSVMKENKKVSTKQIKDTYPSFHYIPSTEVFMKMIVQAANNIT